MTLLVCVLFTNCASPRRMDGGIGAKNFRSQQIEPEARTLFFQAERLFAAKKLDDAQRLYQQVKTKYPRGRAQMLSSYRLGTIYYYREEYQAASKEFDYFLARFPNSELAFDVNYNLAAAEYQQGNYERTYQILSRFRMADVQAQGPRRAEVIYQLTAQTAAAMGNHAGAVAAYAAQMQLPLDERTRSVLGDNVDTHLAQVTNRAELDRLLGEVSEPATRQKITARLSGLATTETAALVDGSTGTDDPRGLPLTSGTSAEKRNIGVILPLSGKFQAYGKKALDGILLAAQSFTDSPDEDFNVFIEDSGSSPAMAQQAVDNLFYQHKVIAIIGPLSWKESVAVAERSQQLGVLNLSLSAKEGLSERGAYLFQNALTPKVQVENLVNHVVQEKSFKRFAILAPNDNFGRDMANQFWDLAEKYGAKVVAYESYPADERDFQAPVKALTGVADPKFRKNEQQRIDEYVAAQKQKTGKEPKTVRLPPVVDFDAIFIPDSPKNVSNIAASLAYYDVTGVPLLGTTEWNSDQLYKRGGKYVEGAIFPGGISMATRNPRQREFIRSYADAFGAAPDLLSGQSFEAMVLIAAAINKSSSDRNDLVSELSSLREFDSPLGQVSFDSTRLARRRIPVLSLGQNGTVVEAQ